MRVARCEGCRFSEVVCFFDLTVGRLAYSQYWLKIAPSNVCVHGQRVDAWELVYRKTELGIRALCVRKW